MSKSLGNQYTLKDILEKGHSPLAVRYLLLTTYYRQQLNFTFDGLEAARNSLERYNDFYNNLKDYPGSANGGEAKEYIDKLQTGFEEALDEDLNISSALGKVFDYIRDINRLRSENRLTAEEKEIALQAMEKIDTVLDFLRKDETGDLDIDIDALIEKRTEAKKNKDYATADKIRADLLAEGIILEDTPDGTKWKRKI
jgi:cysteinyl-tRNA synthetase